MFRIEFVKLKGHPQLGDIDLDFSDNLEYKETEFPYTSVIIGSNGTGKSFILRTIAEIFRQFQDYSISNKKGFNLPYSLHLRYLYNDNIFEIVTSNFQSLLHNARKQYIFYKNRPLDLLFESNTQFYSYEILHNELKYPSKLIVNSVMNNDRFVFKNTKYNDFYQYLGARSTSSTSSTKSAVKKIIKHVFNATGSSEAFVNNLKDLLSFLDFEKTFNVVYKTKINKLFFSQQLTVENFKNYFETWWDSDFTFTNRSKENPLWSIPYYNHNFKDNITELERIVSFLNNLPSRKNIFFNKPRSSSKIIQINLFDMGVSPEDLYFIKHLENLDIINLEGININKNNKNLSISEVSSGEYHLLISLIGIFANISDNSLILIDEPEISLHPNWQMRYISFLKKVFKKYSNSHFILTTHSHFLVSDLQDQSSYLIGLKREDNKLRTVDIDRNTYGWSAEEVLYKIFDVRTTRNYYLEMDLRELLNLISQKSENKKQISILIERLKQVQLDKHDPLLLIVQQATNYLQQ